MNSTNPESLPSAHDRRVGVFIIGARGAVASCVALGASALRSGRIDTTGLVTERELFRGLNLIDPGKLIFGGAEVRSGNLYESAVRIAAEGIVTKQAVDAERDALLEIDRRIYPGILDSPDAKEPDAAICKESLAARGLSPLETVQKIKTTIADFRASAKADIVIIVNIASSEVARENLPEWASCAEFERDLAKKTDIPASCLYAYAAIDSGCPYINFTPSPGSTPRAFDELAKKRGVPHAGSDGKTGETLMKTVLAPLFRDRNLNVLAWEGYNMLGNGDGKTLQDPSHKAGKIANKDRALRQLLGNGPDLHTRVSIEYVPSLGDWKTAWDFIHFSGFFGTRMTLQFTWSGSDSALAAPLVLDLVRLAELALRRGESGVMAHTAAFFKSPLGTTEHDFHKQNEMLARYVAAATTPRREL
ncbi:MAG: inositol-3-phosphate synthase [Planctomycetota bacterium]